MLDQNQFPMHISHHMLLRLIPKDISIWTIHVYMSNTCIYYLNYSCMMCLCKENKKFTKKSTQKKLIEFHIYIWFYFILFYFGNLQKLELLESHLFKHGIMSQRELHKVACTQPSKGFVSCHCGEAKLIIGRWPKLLGELRTSIPLHDVVLFNSLLGLCLE